MNTGFSKRHSAHMAVMLASILIALAATLAPSFAFAQSQAINAQIEGTVTDANGVEERHV